MGDLSKYLLSPFLGITVLCFGLLLVIAGFFRNFYRKTYGKHVAGHNYEEVEQ